MPNLGELLEGHLGALRQLLDGFLVGGLVASCRGQLGLSRSSEKRAIRSSRILLCAFLNVTLVLSFHDLAPLGRQFLEHVSLEPADHDRGAQLLLQLFQVAGPSKCQP
jgi:hypothetical protein